VRRVGVDAGKHVNAWVLLDEFAFVALGLCSGAIHSQVPEPDRVGLVAIELPQIYRTGRQKGDPNDLIAVAAEAGKCSVGFSCPTRFYKPRDWKGTMSKSLSHSRIRDFYLTVDPSSLLRFFLALEQHPLRLRHNLWDALGVTSWAARKALR